MATSRSFSWAICLVAVLWAYGCLCYQPGYDDSNYLGYGSNDDSNYPGYGGYANSYKSGYGGYAKSYERGYGGYDDFYKRRSYDGSYQPGYDNRPKNFFYSYGSSYQPYQNRYDQNPSYSIHRPTLRPSPGSLDYCRLAEGAGGIKVSTFGPLDFRFIYKGISFGAQAQAVSNRDEMFVITYTEDVRTLASLGLLRSRTKADFKGRGKDLFAMKVYDSRRSRPSCFIASFDECNLSFQTLASIHYDYVRQGKVNVDFKDVLKYRVNGTVSRAMLKRDNPALAHFCEEAGNNLYTAEPGEASGPHRTLSIFTAQGPTDIDFGKNYE